MRNRAFGNISVLKAVTSESTEERPMHGAANHNLSPGLFSQHWNGAEHGVCRRVTPRPTRMILAASNENQTRLNQTKLNQEEMHRLEEREDRSYSEFQA